MIQAHHQPGRQAITAATYRRQARFRYELRRFLRFSEKAARSAGITPQQHQLLLGVAGFTDRGWANISELTEFMQLRHNAVVGLIARAARARLVRKSLDARDRRVVQIRLAPRGAAVLKKLTQIHLAHLHEGATWERGAFTFRTKERQ